MSRTKSELTGITCLGATKIPSPAGYDATILEAFANKHPDSDTWVTLTCPEFTSLCPITGQPDFATLTIQYVPNELLVESKSLKLYLFGFRNRGDFHEDCVNIIHKDLCALLAPRYLEVQGRFVPRGGISIDPYVNYGQPETRFAEWANERLRSHDATRAHA